MTEKSNAAIVESLCKLLASTYTLYLKSHNYHWNVTGPMFTSLHTLFEQQYTELALAIDEIAERIRSRGAHAPGSFVEFGQLSEIREETGHPTAREMIQTLSADQETVAAVARTVVEAAEVIGDLATADLGTRRMDVHEKNAWLLRSHLE